MDDGTYQSDVARRLRPIDRIVWVEFPKDP